MPSGDNNDRKALTMSLSSVLDGDNEVAQKQISLYATVYLNIYSSP
jgi:hypothetical protein